MSSTMSTETQKMSASRRWLMQGALNMEDPGSRAEAGSGSGATSGLWESRAGHTPACPVVTALSLGPHTPHTPARGCL